MQRTPVQHEDGPKKELLDCCDKDTEDDKACCPIKIPSQDFFYGKEGRPRKHYTQCGNYRNSLTHFFFRLYSFHQITQGNLLFIFQ